MYVMIYVFPYSFFSPLLAFYAYRLARVEPIRSPGPRWKFSAERQSTTPSTRQPVPIRWRPTFNEGWKMTSHWNETSREQTSRVAASMQRYNPTPSQSPPPRNKLRRNALKNSRYPLTKGVWYALILFQQGGDCFRSVLSICEQVAFSTCQIFTVHSYEYFYVCSFRGGVVEGMMWWRLMSVMVGVRSGRMIINEYGMPIQFLEISYR